MNLASLIRGIALRLPEKEAVVADGRVYRFRDFWRHVSSVAALYGDWGLVPGDRILLVLPNGPEFLFFHFAALKTGTVSVPVKTDWRSREVREILANCRPRVLVSCDRWLAENAAALEDDGRDLRVVSVDGLSYDLDRGDDRVVPVPSHTPASIHYTYSGDGYPKGAALTHANHVYAATGYARHQGFTTKDRFLVNLPMAHVYALSGCVNSGLISGSTLVIVNRHTPKAIFAAVESSRITVLSSVPAVFEILARFRLKDRYDRSSLRLCVSGGDFLPEDLQREFQASLGCQIVQGYGLTECLPVVCNPPGERNRPGTLGIPGRRDIHVAIADEHGRPLPAGDVGQIVIRSPTTMQGYYGMPDDTRRAVQGGWLRTGDLGWLDRDGFLHFSGMSKPIYNVYGNKVDPLEVRRALIEHPAVRQAECCLKKPPVPLRLAGGVEIGCRVTVANGHAITPEALRGFLRRRIADYKIPTDITVASETSGSSP